MLLVAVYDFPIFGITSMLDITEVKIASSSSAKPTIAFGVFIFTVMYAIRNNSAFSAYLDPTAVILIICGISCFLNFKVTWYVFLNKFLYAF